MKHLKNCICLGSIVKIYVPSTYNINENLDCSAWIDKTLTFLAEKFGGATASEALGAWLSLEKGLVKERITVVFAYTTSNDLSENINSVYDFCIEMKEKLKQESIALEVNGELYFV